MRADTRGGSGADAQAPVKIRFTPAAGQELVAAKRWYSELEETLGDAFQRSFDQAAEAAAATPELYRTIYGEKRRDPLRRFPYFLLYQVVAETVVVLGCIHFARDPATSRKRSDAWLAFAEAQGRERQGGNARSGEFGLPTGRVFEECTAGQSAASLRRFLAARPRSPGASCIARAPRLPELEAGHRVRAPA